MLRNFVQGLALVGVVIGTGALGAGCLDRPVTTASPTIKTNFTSAVNQSGIDKVDILTGTIFADPNNTGDNGGHAPTGVFQILEEDADHHAKTYNNATHASHATPDQGRGGVAPPWWAASGSKRMRKTGCPVGARS